MLRATVGAVLRQHREMLGLSQEALGAKAKLHRNYLGSAERGERNVAVEALARWLNALGLSWAQFGTELDARLAAQSPRRRAPSTPKK